MAEINHLVGIKGSRSDVYAAVSTVEGLKTWWTTDIRGVSQVGQTLQFRHGKPRGPDMKVTELKKNEVVKWTCVADPGEWVGTEFTFELTEHDGQVNLRFRQAKWKEITDMLAFCSTKWAAYLVGLKEFVETGRGRPYPHDLQTSHR